MDAEEGPRPISPLRSGGLDAGFGPSKNASDGADALILQALPTGACPRFRQTRRDQLVGRMLLTYLPEHPNRGGLP
jgi:hypothetical protein